ncbi:hypothetical protein SALBM135S_02130 [Streptomyces alboniger]
MSKRILPSPLAGAVGTVGLVGVVVLGAVAAGGLAAAAGKDGAGPSLTDASARYTAPSGDGPGSLTFTADVGDSSGVRGMKVLPWPVSSKLDPTEAELRHVEQQPGEGPVRAHRGGVGRPFQDLEISYRPVELRSLIDQANHERRTLRVNSVERRAGEETQYLDILIQPLTGANGLHVATTISFTDVTVATQLKAEVKRVREDLETAYEELQSTNEELETTNEELQSSIEELETTNEELQSTNEELETTNEELQSGNEELETMNDEMRIRTEELDEARAFLEAVLTSIAAGVVVLDNRLRVKSWNRGAVDLWGLRADEVVDQPFFDLDFGLPTGSLQPLVRQCQQTRKRSGPVGVQALSRIGRPIQCDVFCSPFDGHNGGVVLMMEESRTERSQ